MSSSMRCLRLTKSIDSHARPALECTHRPRPVAGHSELLVRVRAAKLNPSDVLNSLGGFPHTRFPVTPGRDYAGTVESAPGDEALVGTNVFGTSAGELGFTRDGSHAEYIVVPRAGYAAMPESLSFEEAGCVGVVYTTALMMIRKAQLPMDRALSILIIGESGNVGSAVRDIAALQYPEAKITPANRVDGVMSLPEGVKFDAIFSTVPDTGTLQSALKLLAKRSSMVFIASTRPDPGILTLNPLQIYRDDLTFAGVNSCGTTLQESAEQMTELAKMFDSGRLKMRGMEKMSVVKLEDGVGAYEAKINAVLVV